MSEILYIPHENKDLTNVDNIYRDVTHLREPQIGDHVMLVTGEVDRVVDRITLYNNDVVFNLQNSPKIVPLSLIDKVLDKYGIRIKNSTQSFWQEVEKEPEVCDIVMITKKTETHPDTVGRLFIVTATGAKGEPITVLSSVLKLTVEQGDYTVLEPLPFHYEYLNRKEPVSAPPEGFYTIMQGGKTPTTVVQMLKDIDSKVLSLKESINELEIELLYGHRLKDAKFTSGEELAEEAKKSFMQNKEQLRGWIQDDDETQQ